MYCPMPSAGELRGIAVMPVGSGSRLEQIRNAGNKKATDMVALYCVEITNYQGTCSHFAL